ncbi:Phosphoribosylformylglycinamidine synthase, partial [Diplonema papillatum]
TLSNFRGLACCGGFSFGDTFGAGRGWASTIKDNKVAAAEFSAFFNRSNTFTLGVCNGCQMLGSLSSMVPGAAHWPKFTYNASGQYEARVALVKVQEGATSIFFKGMAGAVIPAAVSHGEGRAEFRSEGDRAACQVPARYVDTRGRPTQAFPANPNGSPDGIAGVCSEDGRATIMMPHPERTLRTVANSWSPDQSGDASPWGDFSPWIQFFVNARKWCDQTTA